MTCGQQDVPDEGIDRRAADDPDPLKVLIRRGDHLEVHADDENDGRLEHRLGEPTGCGRLLDRRRVHRRRVDRVPRAVAGRDLGRVPLGGWRGQRRERLSGGALTHDDHPPALAVAAARRESRAVEDVEQRGVGQQLVGELTGGEHPVGRGLRRHPVDGFAPSLRVDGGVPIVGPGPRDLEQLDDQGR